MLGSLEVRLAAFGRGGDAFAEVVRLAQPVLLHHLMVRSNANSLRQPRSHRLTDRACGKRPGDGDLVTTDGPFAESKEHIAGFYIINADDLDAALSWAGKVVNAIGRPIEVRPFVDMHSA